MADGSKPKCSERCGRLAVDRGLCNPCYARLKAEDRLPPKWAKREKHGHTRIGEQHPLYGAWNQMRYRNRVRVVPRWDDFAVFLADMGERPSPAHSLYRLNHDKPYGPGNLEWLTVAEHRGLRERCVRTGEPQACRKCAIIKPLTDFKVENRSLTGYSSICKDCWNAEHRAWRKANPEAQKRRIRQHTLRSVGITAERFDEMLTAQDGKCAICGSTDPGRNGSFHVDHDHACCAGKRSCGRCVRALLCHQCNTMLGNAKDDPVRLRSAAEYLNTRKEVMH